MNTTENLMASAVGQYLSENLSQAPRPTQTKIKKTKKVKQELVAATNDQEDADDPSAKPYPNGRKRASKACYECQRRHTRCGFGRPCERCIRLGLQCVDVQSVKKRGRAQKKSEFMDSTTSGEQGVTTVSSASPSTCSPPTGNHFCHTPNHFLHQQEIQYHQLPHEVSCNKLDVTQDEAELLDCSEDYENRMFSTILNDPILPPPAADKLDQSKPQQQPQQPQMNQQAKSALEQLLSALLFNNNPTITSTLSMSQQQQPAPVPSLVTSILDIINQKHVQPQPQHVSPVPAPTSQPLPQTPLFETPSPSSPAETVDTTSNNLLTVIETQMVDSIFRKNGVDPDTMLGTVSDLHLFFPRPYEFIKNIETCVNSNLFANDNMGVIISTDIPNVNFVSNSIVSKLGYQSSKDLKSYYDVFLPVQMNSIVQDIKEDRERRMSILASATTGGEILRTKYSITEHKTRSLVMDKSGSIMEFVHKYYRVYNINNPCKLECVYSFLYWM